MDFSDVRPLDLVIHSRPINLSTAPSPMSSQTLIWNVSTFEAFFNLDGMEQVMEIITLHYPGLTVIVEVTCE